MGAFFTLSRGRASPTQPPDQGGPRPRTPPPYPGPPGCAGVTPVPPQP